MPEEEKPQVFDITKPTQQAGATSRPIITGYEPASDPMVTPTQPPAVFAEGSSPPPPVQPKVIPISVNGAESSAPLMSAPTAVEPPVEQPAPPIMEPAVMSEPPMPAPTPSAVPPTESLESDALQSKINAHPLFSGTPDTPPIKKRRFKKILLWLFIVLLLAAIGGYLAIDSGLVRGASHLPFHIFKQATPMTQPTIRTPTNTNTQTPAFSYATWQTYDNTATGFTLKYPADWKYIAATKGTNPTDDTFKPVSATALPNIYIENGPTTQTDAATYWSQQGSGRAGTVVESKSSTINSYSAYYVVTTMDGSKLYTYAIVHNGKGVNINLQMDTTDTTSLDILTKIANSIAFN